MELGEVRAVYDGGRTTFIKGSVIVSFNNDDLTEVAIEAVLKILNGLY